MNRRALTVLYACVRESGRVLKADATERVGYKRGPNRLTLDRDIAAKGSPLTPRDQIDTPPERGLRKKPAWDLALGKPEREEHRKKSSGSAAGRACEARAASQRGGGRDDKDNTARPAHAPGWRAASRRTRTAPRALAPNGEGREG